MLLFFSLQTSLILITALVMLFFLGNAAAYSALLGGGACLLPNICFAKIALRYRGARAAKKIVYSFYFGEALKWLLSFILFFLIFIFIDIKGLPFFITYIVGQSVFWFAPLVLKNEHRSTYIL